MEQKKINLISLEQISKIIGYKDKYLRQLRHWVEQGILPEPVKKEVFMPYFDKEEIEKFFKEFIGTEFTKEPFIGLRDAAKILGVGPLQVSKLCREESIPFYELHFGKKTIKTLFRASEIKKAYKIYLSWKVGFYLTHRQAEVNKLVYKWLLELSTVKQKVRERDYEIFSSMVMGSLSQKSASEKYGISEERVRQIYERCILKFRYWLSGIPSAFKSISELKEEVKTLRRDLILAEKNISRMKGFPVKIKSIKLLDAPFDEINVFFSNRVSNVLFSARIKTLRELALVKEKEFLQFRNAGKTALFEVKKVLEEFRLNMGTEYQ